MASAEELARHPAVLARLIDGLRAHNASNTASSTTISRVLLMSDPPSLEAGEITDKGYVNKRTTLERRPEPGGQAVRRTTRGRRDRPRRAQGSDGARRRRYRQSRGGEAVTEFHGDLADLQFVLFDQLSVDRRLGALARYAEYDRGVCEATLVEAKRLAEQILAPLNAVGDREGCRFDGAGNVATPAGYKAAWDTLRAGGWQAVSAPQELGGGGLPLTIDMAVCEMMNGACLAFMMYLSLTLGAARVLQLHGPPATRDRIARNLYTGVWCGTMCLTEAGAGSSLGDCRCRATPTDEPGIYLLAGEKLFISGGDHDLTDNIVHLVLAARRAPAPAPGVCRCSWCRSIGSRTTGLWALATARSSCGSSRRWGSTARRPACSGSAWTARAAASSSARSTTASSRCSC